MDPNQIVPQHSQSQIHEPQQPQQRQQPHPEPSQLPDESYIEKLFPKCQPKPSKPLRANSFGGRRTARLDERQQQPQKRQSRTRHNQTSQLLHQQPQQQNSHKESASRRVSERPIESLMTSNSAEFDGNSTKANALVGSQRSFYDSSESSDFESKNEGKNMGPTNGPFRRSGSNQFGFDAISNVDRGDQPNREESVSGASNSAFSYSKPKTKKYRASTNLQRQLNRSQSSHSKLSDSQSATRSGFSESLNDLNSGMAIQAPEPSAVEGRGEQTYTLSQDNLGTNRPNLDRSNRTCRGIVFAEPPLSGKIGSKKVAEEQLVTTSNIVEHPYPPAASLPLEPRAREQTQQEVLQAPQAAPQEQQPQMQLQPQQKPILAQASVGEAPGFLPAQADRSAIDAIGTHMSAATGPCEPVTASGSSFPAEARGQVDAQQGDEDKFINLFVYDQTVPALKSSEKQTEELSASPQAKATKDQDFISQNSDRACRLLTSDLSINDPDVISNDTSTDELCSVGDNETENSNRQRVSYAKRTLDDGPSTVGDRAKLETDTGPHNPNKSILKHHRSISTLQTVDEKAEISIDDGQEVQQTTTRLDLIDISEPVPMMPNHVETGPIKKSFVPPGFPQRVRPIAKATSIAVSAHNAAQGPQPSPTCAQITTIPFNELAKKPIETSDAQQQEARDEEVPGPSASENPADHLNEFAIAAESQSVVEKNLTEALSKVSIDQMIALDLKDVQGPNLRHHKLPNETSHFSAIRSQPPVVDDEESSNLAPRSSVQFNTLSDAESGLEDNLTPQRGKAANPQPTARGSGTKQDAPPMTRYSNPRSYAQTEEEQPTPTKTALVFPRLDEGLSSEAESCEDEVEEEDDKAMEADVDADDDDEDEDDEDEDEDETEENQESQSNAVDRDPGSVNEDVDPFFRSQQALKPQNRASGSGLAQQPLTTSLNQNQEAPDAQLVKPINHAYNNFVNEETNQTDLKQPASQANQNGIQSNYWMGAVATQQAPMSTQPASQSNQFSIQRNQPSTSTAGPSTSGASSGNINSLRSNNYGQRDDAKTANRLSSDTDNETDRLLGTQRNDQLQKLTNTELASSNQVAEQQTANNYQNKPSTSSREVLIEGVLFNVKYLGSTHTECEGRGEKEDRIHQAELAVHEVKFRNGDVQPPVEVQLFISTEKIMVLDDKKKVIMMDHSLRTISYIADIGDAIVLIVRKKSSGLESSTSDVNRPLSKTSCHVFESNESHTITKSISQAFQVAYTELLKANGGNDAANYLPKELDYQEVLNSQEMPMTELEMFACKENQREVIVPKQTGELLGLSVVESGWGSVLPTAVIASIKQNSPAYRCKKLSVGDQILSIDGNSLVGLSLVECQKILRKTKSQSVARLWVVPCPITVEVKIKRPDTKYQLGFSVQHGVICSLLRGGIAERGGVRVGHRIISINGTTVVGVPHDKIVTLLASSIGEIRMKTCLTSLYRHMLGEEKKYSWV